MNTRHTYSNKVKSYYVILYYFTFYMSVLILACLLILALSIFLSFSLSFSLSLFSEVEIKRLQEERDELIQELQQSKGTNKQNIISTVIIIIIIVELSTAQASHLESVQSDLTTTKQQLEVKTNNN